MLSKRGVRYRKAMNAIDDTATLVINAIKKHPMPDIIPDSLQSLWNL